MVDELLFGVMVLLLGVDIFLGLVVVATVVLVLVEPGLVTATP